MSAVVQITSGCALAAGISWILCLCLAWAWANVIEDIDHAGIEFEVGRSGDRVFEQLVLFGYQFEIAHGWLDGVRWQSALPV